MFSLLQWGLFGFTLLYFVYLRYWKVPVHADAVEHDHHLQSLPSTWYSIMPVLFSQLVCKYGYCGYLFATEWGTNKILPNLITTFGPFSINSNHLNAYLECVDIKDTKFIPSGYFHCLCVKLSLFTLGQRKEFPLRLLGAVHYKNTFKIYKRIGTNDRTLIFIETKVERNIYLTEKHDLTFSVSHKVFVLKDDGQKELICKITDVYLVRAPKKYRVNPDKKSEKDYFEIGDKSAEQKEYKWNKITTNIPLRYSIISGDFNPIHLHKYLAMLFGFKSNIAHGMWSVAKIMHQLCDHTDNAKREQMITIESVFQRPLFVPNKPMLKVIQDTGSNQARFKLFDVANKVIIQGYLV